MNAQFKQVNIAEEEPKEAFVAVVHAVRSRMPRVQNIWFIPE